MTMEVDSVEIYIVEFPFDVTFAFTPVQLRRKCNLFSPLHLTGNFSR